MTTLLSDEDPEPSERFPAGPLYVPVRPGPTGHTVRLFRTPLGERTAVGFTSEHALTATLGTGQSWTRLAAPALRTIVAPLGSVTVTIDPLLTAPAPRHGSESRPDSPSYQGTWGPQAVGALRVTGAAALVTALSYWIG
ncbi:SAV_915 family protein [Streptomyces sp. LHD-70]|uniref:SAV_915 family protein n=1 Tax=Streptomyces sp. LHD-70 TaxID=3072140 RepID=UPI00280E637F|nr:SAV_915 family protein [Streptomyces sp. LHD-70]MDQ8705112.1 SAV_915 family protein [Streptomyces sp. LHD-70]